MGPLRPLTGLVGRCWSTGCDASSSGPPATTSPRSSGCRASRSTAPPTEENASFGWAPLVVVAAATIWLRRVRRGAAHGIRGRRRAGALLGTSVAWDAERDPRAVAGAGCGRTDRVPIALGTAQALAGREPRVCGGPPLPVPLRHRGPGRAAAQPRRPGRRSARCRWQTHTDLGFAIPEGSLVGPAAAITARAPTSPPTGRATPRSTLCSGRAGSPRVCGRVPAGSPR